VLPLRDENPHLLTPIATYALIAANVLAWVFLQGLGSEPALSRSVCILGLIPGELLQTLPAGTAFPISPTAACVIGDTPSWYAPLTSMFLHGGWFHIASNLWFMWIFGNNVEDSMGHVRFVLFYVLCGLAAAGLQVMSDPDSGVPMVGASGAIGGVMGAYIVLYPRVHVHVLVILGFYITTIAVPAVVMLGYWFVLQVFGGFAGEGAGVAFWAHVGGFAAGAILVLLFRDRRLLARHPYYGWSRPPPASRSWHRVR
jgi:membrane associated rhomboid family serine protease